MKKPIDSSSNVENPIKVLHPKLANSDQIMELSLSIDDVKQECATTNKMGETFKIIRFVRVQ